MRVLIVADTSEWLKGSVPTLGGLERQVYYTAEYLRANGVHADIANVYFEGLTPETIGQYDIVHIFNTGGPKGALIMVAHMAKALAKKVIFTPVYWPPDKLLEELDRHGVRVMVHKDKNQWRVPMRRLIESADIIVPNASMEWEATCKDLGIAYDAKPVFVVHNAISLEELGVIVESPFKGKDYVFCAGRLEWRKNQYNLAKAMKILYGRGHKLGLLLAGENAADDVFLSLLKKELEGVQAAWIGTQPASVIYGAMVSARVYCQPSFYETPGLASLEAAALGVPLVVGAWGSEPEYFGSLAEYCIPTDPVSIADAIERALAADPVRWKTLSGVVKRNFTYEAAAEKLLAIYKNVI